MSVDFKKYLEVPFLHGGRAMEGLDCYGLIVHIYGMLGIDIFDIANYEQEWSRQKNYFLDYRSREWEKTHEPRKYDAVLFKTFTGKLDHVGVVVDRYRYIHAHRFYNVMISRFGDKKLKLTTAGFYRHKRLKP